MIANTTVIATTTTTTTSSSSSSSSSSSNIIITLFYRAPNSTEIALKRLTFKTQLKYILSSYRSNTFHTK